MERKVHEYELSYEMKQACCDKCGIDEMKRMEGLEEETAFTLWESGMT